MRGAQVAEHNVAPRKRAVASRAGDEILVRRRQMSESMALEMAWARKVAVALRAAQRFVDLRE